MQGMGGSLSGSNPLILAAFEAALRHQGLIVLILLIIAGTAWVWPYTAPRPRLVGLPADTTEATTVEAAAAPAETATDASVTAVAAPSAAATGAAEHAARTLLRISFGLLWIFDGLLQIQQGMPVGLPTDVVQPAAATSPGWVKHLVNDGTLIWTRHPISAAAATVWIQIGVGVLLLVARRGRLSQWAAGVSIAWGLVVWVFGEAFGGIFGQGQSWLFGAPGAVLLYVVAGVLIALPERVWRDKRLGRALLGVLGVFFVGMAILQAWPGRGFWQGQRDPHATAGSLTSMVQTMSQTSQPHALSSAVSSFGSFDAQHGWFVNLVVVLALAGLGIALVIGREQVTFGALVFGSIFCIAVWVFVQDLGFLGGVGTDPNSMIPTVLLIAAGYLALTRRVEPAPAAEPVAVAATPKRLRPLTSTAGLGVIAVVATFGVVLVGAVPMAFASANTHTDTIVTEAINGQPQPTDTPAPPFELTDQHGNPVNLATFKGRTVALTFLDPVCTTDCPLIAQEFRQVDARIGSTANTAFVAVVANPTYLGVQFVQAFDAQENMNMPNWYFLTGSLAQLRAVWDSYGIQVQTTGSGGMSAHSDTTYVIDGVGHLRTILGADPGNTATDSASFATLLNKEMRAVGAA
jgi:cytochrome oxidase Cu insertion factor (SCO1/SenC/PrrC family)